MKKVAIKEKSLLAKVAARFMKYDRIAIVTGSTIHLYNISRERFLRDKRWLTHELRHVQQYEDHGFLKFLWLYLRESLRNGYWNNCYEAEARASEQDERLMARYEIAPAKKA